MKDSYDVVVIGAGPAGGAAAAITAEGGLSTLLVERDRVPRFHVGESLMPECYWPLQRLGLNERVRNAGWQIKKSVQFVTGTGKTSDPFFFRKHDERECSDTWQVERSEFDKMLFDRAAEMGADTRDETRLADVHFDEDNRATGVTLKTGDGEKHHISSRVVIDATGQQSFIANKLKLKVVNPDLKKSAIWGYWKNARRDEGDNEGATIILQTADKNAWFWFIPQSRGITSVGCVGDRDYLLKGRGTTAEVYAEELANCPGLKDRLMDATQVGGLRATKEFSYTTTQHAGSGWVLVGDAFGFIDPIYSSGVYFALEMGVKAGDAVVENPSDQIEGTR
ncbi:MAG: NAD(P)/FAD-dependent oxidoreductase, partial [Planctomycetota bacterium]